MVTIRRLTVDDWRVWREVRLASLADAPYAFGTTLAEAQTRTDDWWQDSLGWRHQFMAERDGRPVGTAGGYLFEGETHPELISMWVAPEARGSGAGDLLVRAVLDWAQVGGHLAVELWVKDGNARAERLYTRHGFVRTGRTKIEDSQVEVEMRAPVGAHRAEMRL